MCLSYGCVPWLFCLHRCCERCEPSKDGGRVKFLRDCLSTFGPNRKRINPFFPKGGVKKNNVYLSYAKFEQ